jgi:hypothetical protein
MAIWARSASASGRPKRGAGDIKSRIRTAPRHRFFDLGRDLRAFGQVEQRPERQAPHIHAQKRVDPRAAQPDAHCPGAPLQDGRVLQMRAQRGGVERHPRGQGTRVPRRLSQ